MCEGMFPRYMRELYVCLRLGQSRSTRKNSTVKPCPCAVAGAMLTRWCHSASVIVDPRRASAASMPRSVTRDSTQSALTPVGATIEEICAASLIQVKRRSRTVALCFDEALVACHRERRTPVTLDQVEEHFATVRRNRC